MNEKIHDITILYLSQQDISSLTPKQLFDKYEAIYAELKEHHKNKPHNDVTIMK